MRLDDWIREVITDISEEYELKVCQSIRLYELIMRWKGVFVLKDKYFE